MDTDYIKEFNTFSYKNILIKLEISKHNGSRSR